MRPLLAGARRSRGGWAGRVASLQRDLPSLAAHQLQASSALTSPAPVAPEQRRQGDGQWMQEQAHPARLPGVPGMPLAVLAPPAGTAIAPAGRREDAQAAIGLAAVFRRRERLPGGTAQGAIGLERKGSASEAALLPGLAWHGQGIAWHGSGGGFQ